MNKYFCDLIESIIGYALPLYASIVAINEGDKEKQAYLVKYWFPLYEEIKLGLFIWLALFKGADMLFEKVISPAFKKFEPQIEAAATKIGNSFVQQITKSAYDFVAKMFGKPAADMAKAGLEAKKEEMEKETKRD